MFYAVAKVFKLGDGTHSRKQKVLEREAKSLVAQLTRDSARFTLDARRTPRETQLEVLKILLPAGGRVSPNRDSKCKHRDTAWLNNVDLYHRTFLLPSSRHELRRPWVHRSLKIGLDRSDSGYDTVALSLQVAKLKQSGKPFEHLLQAPGKLGTL